MVGPQQGVDVRLKLTKPVNERGSTTFGLNVVLDIQSILRSVVSVALVEHEVAHVGQVVLNGALGPRGLEPLVG